jgi:hypothetical protein
MHFEIAGYSVLRTMKTLLASIICLLLGLAGGFLVGFHYSERRVASEASAHMMRLVDSDSRLEAARGIRAIELIQSGDTQQAIRMFSIPVADFYSGYAHLANNDEKTKQLLRWVEQIASTNATVANAIHGNSQ